MSSDLWPVQEAFVERAVADTRLSGELGEGKRIHDQVAPANSVPAYIVIGSGTENSAAVFGRGGKNGTLTIHIWTKEASKRKAFAIYDHLERLFHRKPLALAGGRSMVTGALSWTIDSVDPVTNGLHAVVTYEVTTRGSA